MIRALAICACLAGVAHAAPRLAIQPHLGELATDGFVVACETAEPTTLSLELARGGGAFVANAASTGTRHRLRATGLSPREPVRWRIVAGGEPLAEGTTQTAPPDDATALDFLVYGDSRDGDDEGAIVAAAASGSAAFALHTGDFVPTGDDDAAWAHAFAVERPLLASVPLYFAVGNHETLGDPALDRARRYLPGPTDRTYYTFRIGPARIIALDSNRIDPAQTAWLAQTLADAAREPGHPHVFAFMHHPAFSTGGHCGAATEQAAWVELFERYRPTAIFAGHDHAYERLDRNGVRYFVSGGAGAPVYAEREVCPARDRDAKRVYLAEHHFLRVHLRGEAIEVEVVRPSGPPIEVVRWTRGDPTGPPGPPLLDERRPTGMIHPLTASLAIGALLAVIVLAIRRRAS